MNKNTSPRAADEMLADLGVSGAEADQFRALIAEVAALAHEVPEPSDDVRALLDGAVSPRRRRPSAAGTARLRGMAAVAVGALALGGVSAAAAANRLPPPVQEVVADATGGVVPHPIKPTNAPSDAPGHGSSKPTATRTANTSAPGQIQKSTKPDPRSPGPAHPVDPGARGRARHQADVNGADQFKTEPRNGKSD